MPKAADKIIINNLEQQGLFKAIEKQNEATIHVAAEAEDRGFLNNLDKFKPRQDANCKNLREALLKYLADQYTVTQEMSAELDSLIP